MTWRGTTTPADRFFASLPYLLPLVEGIMFGAAFFSQFPAAQMLFLPLLPILAVYNGFPFAGIIVFLLLLMLVVRNPNINHFIRFNTMQAILLDIVLILCSLVMNYVLMPALKGGLAIETLMNVIFLGMLAAVIYSVGKTVMGQYAEIPTLSDAVYMQVR